MCSAQMLLCLYIYMHMCVHVCVGQRSTLSSQMSSPYFSDRVFHCTYLLDQLTTKRQALPPPPPQCQNHVFTWMSGTGTVLILCGLSLTYTGESLFWKNTPKCTYNRHTVLLRIQIGITLKWWSFSKKNQECHPLIQENRFKTWYDQQYLSE